MLRKPFTALCSTAILLVALTSCGSEESRKTAALTLPAETPGGPSAVSDTPASNQVPQSSGTLSIERIADIMCDSMPQRLGAEAEALTKTSWSCNFGSDNVRIDEYADADQRDVAIEMLLEIYSATTENASLADYPFICGELWVAGFDFNESRDLALSALSGAGVKAGTC